MKRRSDIEVERLASIPSDASLSIHMVNDLSQEQGYIVWGLVEGKERTGKLLATSTSAKRLSDYAFNSKAREVAQNFDLNLIESEQ